MLLFFICVILENIQLKRGIAPNTIDIMIAPVDRSTKQSHADLYLYINPSRLLVHLFTQKSY